MEHTFYVIFPTNTRELESNREFLVSISALGTSANLYKRIYATSIFSASPLSLTSSNVNITGTCRVVAKASVVYDFASSILCTSRVVCANNTIYTAICPITATSSVTCSAIIGASDA